MTDVLQPASERMLHLDALRLPAAVGIVVFHMLLNVDLGRYQAIVISRSQSLALLVDLFFVISGFVIFEVYGDRVGNWKGYGQFIQRRIARLSPLHWLLLAIFVFMPIGAAALGQGVRHPEVFAWRCIPGNLFFLQATGLLCPFRSFNTPSWSISAEMVLYVAFPIVVIAANRARIAPLVLAAGAFTVLTWLFSDSWMAWMVPGGIWRAVPSFLFGCGLASIRETLPGFKYGGHVAAASLAVFLAGVVTGLSPICLLGFLYVAAISAILADADHKGGRITRAIAMGAQLTYSSYMIHVLVINLLVSLIAERALHLTGNWKNFVALCTFALIWPLSYLSLRYFELPMRRKIAAWRGVAIKPTPETVAP